MEIDLASFTPTTNKAISTQDVDLSSFTPSNAIPQEKPSPISSFLRKIFKNSTIEKVQTLQYELDRYAGIESTDSPETRQKKYKDMLDGKQSVQQKQVDFALQQRESQIVDQGVLRQLEVPMTGAIAATVAAAPIATVVNVGAFSIADHFFNARRWIEEKAPNTSPLIKDIVEIVDFTVKAGAIGGGFNIAKKASMKRMSDINAPKAVDIPAEQVSSVLKNNPEVAKALEVKPEHIQASENSGAPISVPIEKVIDLANTKEWPIVKDELIGKSSKTSDSTYTAEFIPEFKTSKDAIEFGRVNKENKNVIDELKRLHSEEKVKLDKILKEGKVSDEGAVIATKAQLYREAIDAAEGRIKKQPLTLTEINAKDTANVATSNLKKEALKYKTVEEFVASKKLEMVKPSEDIGVFSKPEYFDSGKSGISNSLEYPSKDRPLLQGRDYGSIVYRDNNGNPQGVLTFKIDGKGKIETNPEFGASVEVSVNPEFRRKGIATKLYDKAKELGFDVDAVGERVFTKDGLALQKSRLTAIYNEAHSAKARPAAATPPAKPPIEPPSDVTAGSPENRPPEYIQNRKTYTGGKKTNAVMADVQKLTDKLFVPLSTRLYEVAPKLMYALRKHIFDINKNNDAAIKPLKEFAKKAKKLTVEDFKDLDIALKNKDTAVIEEIINRNKLSKEYKEIKDILSDIYKRAKEAGIEVGFIEDYWPRRVSDVKGYMDYLRGKDNWTIIEREIAREQDKLGRPISEEEQAFIADQVLRGYGTDKITVSKPSNVKSRKIATLTPEMNVFYKDSMTALAEYIDAMNNRIEVNKFFGIGKNADQSIGKYVNDLIKEGMISASQEREVSAVLKTYFGKVGTGPLVSAYRNLAYVYTMGSPIAALTQVQDLAFSLAFNGYYETGKALFSKSRILKEDIYIHDIASEFNSDGATAKMVRTVFQATGLEKLDALGKSVYISAAFGRLSKQAKNNKLEYNLDEIFGVGKGEQVRQDLINKKMTQDTKFLLFSELLDVQPAALSELPAQYVAGGNSRIFYQLKTYSIKQIDVYHRKVFKEFKTDPRKAMKNLMALTTALMALGVSIDSIKDTLLGRKIRITDTVADNILKLFGFSRYTIYKAKEDGIGSAALSQILPPIGLFDDIGKDVMDMTKEDSEFELKDSRVLGGIPVVGKFYYWWYGKGKTIEEKRIDKEFEN